MAHKSWTVTIDNKNYNVGLEHSLMFKKKAKVYVDGHRIENVLINSDENGVDYRFAIGSHDCMIFARHEEFEVRYGIAIDDIDQQTGEHIDSIEEFNKKRRDQREITEWNEMKNSGRLKDVLKYGVLQDGLPTGVGISLFTLFIDITSGSNFTGPYYNGFLFRSISYISIFCIVGCLKRLAKWRKYRIKDRAEWKT